MHIHIANLSQNIIESDLGKLFSAYGKVSFIVIIRDRKNDRSKGYAFLEMPLRVQGEQAIMALNNMELDGQHIIVREIEYKAGEFNN